MQNYGDNISQVECEKCKKIFMVYHEDSKNVKHCPFCWNEDVMDKMSFDPNYKLIINNN